MTRAAKIKAELKALRQHCICQDADPILRDVAYAIEQAVRYVTEDGIRGWRSLGGQAREAATIMRGRKS